MSPTKAPTYHVVLRAGLDDTFSREVTAGDLLVRLRMDGAPGEDYGRVDEDVWSRFARRGSHLLRKRSTSFDWPRLPTPLTSWSRTRRRSTNGLVTSCCISPSPNHIGGTRHLRRSQHSSTTSPGTTGSFGSVDSVLHHLRARVGCVNSHTPSRPRVSASSPVGSILPSEAQISSSKDSVWRSSATTRRVVGRSSRVPLKTALSPHSDGITQVRDCSHCGSDFTRHPPWMA